MEKWHVGTQEYQFQELQIKKAKLHKKLFPILCQRKNMIEKRVQWVDALKEEIPSQKGSEEFQTAGIVNSEKSFKREKIN